MANYLPKQPSNLFDVYRKNLILEKYDALNMDLMKQVDKDLKIVKDEMAYIAVLRMQGATLKNASKLEDFLNGRDFVQQKIS